MSLHSTPFHLGLTGGIGSGKSTVASIMVEQGAGLIDADELSRRSTGPGGSAMQAILQAFGETFVDPQGALDRNRMRALCFEQPQARARLESIIHPIVQADGRKKSAELAQQGHSLIVWDIPLLAESSHWRARLNKVVVVDCPRTTQIERVRQRSAQQGQALEVAQIEAIIQAQSPRLKRLGCADGVLYNDGLSLAQLTQQVLQLLQTLRTLPV